MVEGNSLLLGEERYTYDSLHYMVVSVTLPLSGVRLDASPRKPSFGLRLEIDPAQLGQWLAESAPLPVPSLPSGRDLFVERTDPSLLDALLRRLYGAPPIRDMARLRGT
ncbi:AraC family transcriptional regulator [Pseudomonas fulva]|nr:AraC family transcriptional regulator [Pseudomonas fulva]